MEKFSKNSIKQEDLRSTPGDFDRFINSKMWYDMRKTIEDRIEYLKERMLLLPDSQDSMTEMIAIKNQMKAWNEMLGVPAILKQHAHAEQSHRNKEEN